MNDVDFHVEIATPYLIHDNVNREEVCDWDAMGKEVSDKLKLDHVQFNASWMKREFIEKVCLLGLVSSCLLYETLNEPNKK